jgi:hypothetical protein
MDNVVLNEQVDERTTKRKQNAARVSRHRSALEMAVLCFAWKSTDLTLLR